MRIDDPSVMVGLKEASIELDFAALLESDEKELTRFVNGGRVYFEANVFGYQTSSFTTKGFFDQEGYEEPVQPPISNAQMNKMKQVGVGLVVFLMIRCLFNGICAAGKKVRKQLANRKKLKSD